MKEVVVVVVDYMFMLSCALRVVGKVRSIPRGQNECLGGRISVNILVVLINDG